ncbi:sugar transporter domain-containing protein [Phthorimaea operculella]|nr:sugar transporter domain-containing protein [Phthorimaea operculella]
MSIIGTIYEDVTTDALGDIGSWQWLVTMVSTILMTSSFFRYYEDIFLLHPSSVKCIPDDDHEDIANETLCSYTLSNDTEIVCVQWHLKLLWVFWIKKSWLLFCDDKMKLLLTAVIFQLATIFGYVIFGLVADSFGRKVALIVDVFSVLFLRTAATFCDSEAWFRLILFLEALFGTATTFVALIIVSEIASIGWRSWLNVIVMSPRLIALVSTVHMANAAGNPETYNLIGCFFGLVFILVLKWVPESPQWMLYNRKIHLAENLLSKAATKNNITISAEFKIRPVNQRVRLRISV